MLSLITLNGYPSILKFAFAPIVDTYYSTKIGKRKTYIVGISIFHSILWIILSFWMDDFFNEDKIFYIVVCGLIFNFTGVLKYAADFGFLVTHFRPEV